VFAIGKGSWWAVFIVGRGLWWAMFIVGPCSLFIGHHDGPCLLLVGACGGAIVTVGGCWWVFVTVGGGGGELSPQLVGGAGADGSLLPDPHALVDAMFGRGPLNVPIFVEA